MSDFAQALLISGGIATAVIATGMGRRKVTLHSLLRPIMMVAGVAFFYLKGMPTGSSQLWLYAAALILGAACAAVATLFTGMDRDVETGRVYTICGIGFVSTWLVVAAARVLFVWEADNNAGFRNWLGTFLMQHHLPTSSIAPFFVIWALTMVVGRVAMVLVRRGRLNGAATGSSVRLAA